MSAMDAGWQRVSPAPYCVTITFATPQQVERETLEDLLFELQKANEDWMLYMLEQGFKPPCCAKCAGVLYREPSEFDYKNGSILFKSAADVLRDKVAACGSIAAYDAAAANVMEGGEARVHIVKVAGAGNYHAVIMTPGGIEDPTIEMERG